MTTRVGKTVYPNGPLHAKYGSTDCRFNDKKRRNTFSRYGGWVDVVKGVSRWRRRKEEKIALLEAMFPKLRERRAQKTREARKAMRSIQRRGR